MRLHVLSDLHLGLQGMPPPQVEADVTILAGDILRPASAAMEWAATPAAQAPDSVGVIQPSFPCGR